MATAAYREAIRALNTLQIRRKLPQDVSQTPGQRLQGFQRLLGASGVEPEQLDGLNVIHVAGTKGKGSTCCFVESILRCHGFRTGFYSSPHLVSVRERFRIDGKPIAEEDFVRHFWRLYTFFVDVLSYAFLLSLDRNVLQESVAYVASQATGMIRYFQFLTIMMFHIFLESKVDVAIVEVGVGGMYDSTNVVKKPVVCGISRLDYDHLNILGHSMEEIAWNKAGILKPGSMGVTVCQVENAMRVMEDYAEKVQCPLLVCPEFSDFALPDGDGKFSLSINGQFQKENASLAVQLARIWMIRTGKASPFSNVSIASGPLPERLKAGALSQAEVIGLNRSYWPGRFQKFTLDGINFYLDGAHTKISMQCCASWFNASATMDQGQKALRILVFHCTKGRDPKTLLTSLLSCHFDIAIFCSTLMDHSDDLSSDVWSMEDRDCARDSVQVQMSAWVELCGSQPCTTYSFECIKDAYAHIKEVLCSESSLVGMENPNILVTGSLYLVGGFLSIINPSLGIL